MTKREFYLLLDELLENDPGTITGNEKLSELPRWDSLALMGFIALLDQHFGIVVSAKTITDCVTVGDLVRLAGDKIT